MLWERAKECDRVRATDLEHEFSFARMPHAFLILTIILYTWNSKIALHFHLCMGFYRHKIYHFQWKCEGIFLFFFPNEFLSDPKPKIPTFWTFTAQLTMSEFFIQEFPWKTFNQINCLVYLSWQRWLYDLISKHKILWHLTRYAAIYNIKLFRIMAAKLWYKLELML